MSLMSEHFDPKFYLTFYPDLLRNGVFTRARAKAHWLKHGKQEGRLGSMQDPRYLNNLSILENHEKSIAGYLEESKAVDQNPPINILTRTHGREERFLRCLDSIKKQNYKNLRHFVSVQDERDFAYVSKAGVDTASIVRVKKESNASHYYNLFINRLLDQVEDGWVIFLDDDDQLASPNSFKVIARHLNQTDKLVYWKAWFPDKIIPRQENPFLIEWGDITSCCFTFPVKYREYAYWDDQRGGDYRCFKNLLNHLEPERINLILAKAEQIGGGMSTHENMKKLKTIGNYYKKLIGQRVRDHTEKIPGYFDHKIYASYPDLRKSGISGRRSAWIHWKYYGSKENRIPSKISIENISFVDKPLVDVSNKIIYLIDKGIDSTQDGYAVKSHQTLLCLKEQSRYEIIPVIRPGNNLFQERYVIDDIEYIKLANPENCLPNTQEYFKNYYDRLLEFSHERKISLLHACSNFVNGMIASLVTDSLKISFIYEVRGLWEISASANHPEFENTELFEISKRYETKVCLKADQVLVINSGIEEVLGNRGIDVRKIKIIPFSVFSEGFAKERKTISNPFGELHGELVIGHFGSLNAYEGLDDLIKVAKQIKDEGNNNFRIIIIGDGPQKQSLIEQIERSDLKAQVRMLDPLPYADILAYYELVDLVCLPRKETEVTKVVLPMKLVEAMALKKPVLVSDLQPLTDVVKHRHNGFVFEAGNLHDLKTGLVHIQENKHEVFERLRFDDPQQAYHEFIGNIYSKLITQSPGNQLH